MYARKSAPPHNGPSSTTSTSAPPPSAQSSSNQNSEMGSDENSAAVANRQPPPPVNAPNGDEPMDQDCPTHHPPPPPPPPPPSDPKKVRNRNKAKKNQAKSTPDVEKLLASLEAQVGSGSGSPHEEGGKETASQIPLHPSPLHNKAEPSTTATITPGGNPEAHTPEPQSSSASKKKGGRQPRSSATPSDKGSAQRTREKTPCPKADAPPSHNRQWKASDHQDTGLSGQQSEDRQPPPTKTTQADRTESSSSSSSSSAAGQPAGMGLKSAYTAKPKPDTQICYDVSSHRFIPDDDKRIAILLRKMLGDEMDTVDLTSDNKTIIHDFPTVYSQDVTGVKREDAPGSSTLYAADDSRFLTISDFASIELPDISVFHTVTRRDNLTFVVVYRPENSRGRKRWEFPPLTLCQDYINDLLSSLFSVVDDGSAIAAASAYSRSGKWGKLQTIVLNTASTDALTLFRRQFALKKYKGFSFDTYPRDVAVAKADISILLKASMKTFQTDIIPKVLFSRNQDVLAGALRVLSSRFFSENEKSHRGESKEHWRSIDLKGDEQVMRCLRFIPESKPLLLGYDPVQIRGGLRPQDPDSAPSTGHKRAWSSFPTNDQPLLPTHCVQPNTLGSGSPNTSTIRGGAKRGRIARGGRRGRGGRKL